MDGKTQRAWLRFGAGLVIAFGVLIALASHPATGGVTVFLADLLIWPLDGAETGAAAETRLINAIAGGVMTGWGWMLWQLAGEGMERAPDLSRRIILGSIWAWFIVDSAGSLAAGAPLNVLGNIGFLLIFILPLRQRPAPSSA